MPLGFLLNNCGNDKVYDGSNTYIYTGKDSNWYSQYLVEDCYNSNTSYDKYYRNSYNYQTNNDTVL